MNILKPALISAAMMICGLSVAAPLMAQETYTEKTEKYDVRLVPVAADLEHPWGMDFLPNGDVLVTERRGKLFLVRMPSGEKVEVQGLPEVAEIGQGGLLDVMVHPQFTKNQIIFLSYTGRSPQGFGTEVVRAKLNGPRISDVRVIFEAVPKTRGRVHFGSRLLWGKDGKLYITLGDRGQKDDAQNPKTHLGSTIRINEDGSVPQDNPFYGHAEYRPEIFTYGNRNVQGIALNPETGQIWAHEHGPKGGDEINILKNGKNYGWPAVTYGVDYTGFQISDKTSAPDMESPILYWTPSIAPSGMIFYTGDQFPAWKGSVFVGALVQTHLRRIEFDGAKEVGQEVLLKEHGERIRDVAQGPDGFIYLLSDETYGSLYRLEPVQ